MRWILDTEFTAFRDGVLISLGLCSELADGPELYLEHPQAAEGAGFRQGDAVQRRVLEQLGRVPGARVASQEELSSRLVGFFREYTGAHEVCFDYKLDGRFFEEALGDFYRYNPSRFVLRNIADEVSSPACREALNTALHAKNPGGLLAHHALHDARALRAAWSVRDLSSGTLERAHEIGW